MSPNLDLEHLSKPPARSDFRIGIIGAGFIVRDVQLVAYRNAGFTVDAIASRSFEAAQEVAALHGIPRVYENPCELLEDESIEILDIAIPPHRQLEMVELAVRRRTPLRGILCQKPLSTNLNDARRIVALCSDAGIALAVNQNMRCDQSIRALKTLLRREELGVPVLATIEMRAVPHWQVWLQEYDRLTLLNMSVHHLDSFRFLFGEPESVFVSARKDPRTEFGHRDGIAMYILEYANGFRASGWDDVWAGPTGPAADRYIKWRVEGTEGMAEGHIGWPGFPNRQPSTIEYTSGRYPGCRFSPSWNEVWIPDAFEGTMGQLMDAVSRGVDPEISGRDNLGTMSLIEACYRSLEEHRVVYLDEFAKEGNGFGPDLKP
jgi:predicted dehydrogenase